MYLRWLKKENIEAVVRIKGRKDPKGLSFILSAGVVLCFLKTYLLYVSKADTENVNLSYPPNPAF